MTRAIIVLLALFSPLAAQAQAPASLVPRVRFETSAGNFVVELDAVRAPLTAENFLRYVRDGGYDGTVFHRVIANFVIQGGGYDDRLAARTPQAPIRTRAATAFRIAAGRSVSRARTPRTPAARSSTSTSPTTPGSTHCRAAGVTQSSAASSKAWMSSIASATCARRPSRLPARTCRSSGRGSCGLTWSSPALPLPPRPSRPRKRRWIPHGDRLVRLGPAPRPLDARDRRPVPALPGGPGPGRTIPVPAR